jgi:hypothetical protein
MSLLERDTRNENGMQRTESPQQASSQNELIRAAILRTLKIFEEISSNEFIANADSRKKQWKENNKIK